MSKKHKEIDTTKKLWNQVIPIRIYGILYNDELRKRILKVESKYDMCVDDEEGIIYTTIKTMQKLMKHGVIKPEWLNDMDMSFMTIGSLKIASDIRKEEKEKAKEKEQKNEESDEDDEW